MEDLLIGLTADASPAVDERVTLRLGHDSLLEHAQAEPPGPILLHACRALAALTSGACERVTIPFQGGASLRAALQPSAGEPRLAVTVTGVGGVVLLSDVEVPARPLLHSLTEAVQGFLAELPGSDALAASLDQASNALATRPSDGDPRPLPVADPAGGVVLHHDGGQRVLITLGAQTVPVNEVTPAALGEALVRLVETLLHTRSWPPGVHVVALDEAELRSLSVWRTGEGLFASVVDEAGHDLCPRWPVTLGELAWAALTALRGLPRHLAPARRALLRLMRWDQALRLPIGPPAGPPPGWRGLPARPVTEVVDPLPVARLRHLAWRRIWRQEAPGLVRVETHRDRLLVHAQGGVRALEAATGRVQWQRPHVRPLAQGDPGFVVDDEGALMALDLRTGRPRWRFASGDEGPFRGAWHRARTGRIRTLAMSDTTLFGLDAQGQAAWRYDTCYGHVHRVAAHGPLAWMTADDGMLHAIRLADGARQVALPIEGEADEGPVLCPRGLLITTVREPEGRGLIALFDPLNGGLRWRVELAAPALAPPCVLGDAVVVAHGGADRVTLECLGLADGLLRWRHRDLPMVGPPRCMATDLLLCKTPDGGLLAVDPISGRIRWSLEGEDDDEGLVHNPLPVACRGLLLLPGSTIRALDPRTGRVIRRLDCGELVPAWLHAWPGGDLVIAEDEAVAHYTLGGHLAVVPRPTPESRNST